MCTRVAFEKRKSYYIPYVGSSLAQNYVLTLLISLELSSSSFNQ